MPQWLVSQRPFIFYNGFHSSMSLRYECTLESSLSLAASSSWPAELEKSTDRSLVADQCSPQDRSSWVSTSSVWYVDWFMVFTMSTFDWVKVDEYFYNPVYNESVLFHAFPFFLHAAMQWSMPEYHIHSTRHCHREGEGAVLPISKILWLQGDL